MDLRKSWRRNVDSQPRGKKAFKWEKAPTKVSVSTEGWEGR